MRSLQHRDFYRINSQSRAVNTRAPVLIRIELYSSGNRIISPENQNMKIEIRVMKTKAFLIQGFYDREDNDPEYEL